MVVYIVGTILWLLALWQSYEMLPTPAALLPLLSEAFAIATAAISTALYLLYLIVVSWIKQHRKVFWVVLQLCVIQILASWSLGCFDILFELFALR